MSRSRLPARARPGGVFQRAGHTESAVDLCRLAGLEPAGVLAEVTDDDGTVARRLELAAFAAEHDLVMLTVADLVRFQHERRSLVTRGPAGRVPTPYGEFTVVSFRSQIDDCEHVALILGEVHQGLRDDAEPVLVRVHSECLTGDVSGSRRCDCGEQLDQAFQRIGEVGRGIIICLRGHEGRGIGLSHKLRSYALQDAEFDTVDANLAQGLPVDDREYGVGAQILRELGVRTIALMTNNPAKYRGLTGHEIHIADRLPLLVTPNADNSQYLATKCARLDHSLAESEVSGR